MNEAVIRTRLAELYEVMEPQLAGGAARADEGTYLAHPSANPSMEEVMDRMRLQLRYLVFDLEATRRENKYLRRMLEAKHRPDSSGLNDEPPAF